MTKQTKMLVGVGVLAAVGYFVWKSQKPKTTANASGRKKGGKSGSPRVDNQGGSSGITTTNIGVYGGGNQGGSSGITTTNIGVYGA